MKKLILMILLSTSFSVLAGAETDSQITKVSKADYICTNAEGGAYAIKVGKSPRIWQSELDGNGAVLPGLELKNVKVQALRCLNCFDLSGDLGVFGQVVHMKGELRGNMEAVKLKLAFLDDRGQTEEFPQMDCKKGTK